MNQRALAHDRGCARTCIGFPMPQGPHRLWDCTSFSSSVSSSNGEPVRRSRLLADSGGLEGGLVGDPPYDMVASPSSTASSGVACVHGTPHMTPHLSLPLQSALYSTQKTRSPVSMRQACRGLGTATSRTVSYHIQQTLKLLPRTFSSALRVFSRGSLRELRCCTTAMPTHCAAQDTDGAGQRPGARAAGSGGPGGMSQRRGWGRPASDRGHGEGAGRRQVGK